MAFTATGGGLNTYVPSTNSIATGALQVEFTRAINTFAITQYAQIVPVNQMTGYYLRLNPDDNVRYVSGNEFNWPLGNSRPLGKENESDFIAYQTQRYAFPFYIPNETVKQAAWDVVAAHARSKAQLAMTARTARAAAILTQTTSSSPFYSYGGYKANGSAFTGGGSWYTSTSQNYIQKAVQESFRIIALATAGAVRPEDVCMVMSPATANKISSSGEVRDYVKNYPAALPFLQGSDVFSKYGLPPYLFGARVVVDDSVQVTTQKVIPSGANNSSRSETRSYIWGDGNVAFLSRPGGLVGVEGATSFSTVQIFAFEDMTVENWDDPHNRRIEGRVIDNSVAAVVAPMAGVYCNNVGA